VTALVGVLLMIPVGTLVAQQVTTGPLAGRVVDENSNPLASATVVATSGQETRSTRTDSNGRFVIPHLTPDTYHVRVDSDGHQSAEQSGVIVSLNVAKQSYTAVGDPRRQGVARAAQR
jgi:hypothetical protein